jgi:LysR family transcriptional regulator, cell division regulator
MDIADLKAFEAVARHGSMSKAAVELHTVQCSVTARIRALEREVGAELFQRHAQGVNLTPAGQCMLPYAARMPRLVADARLAAVDNGTPGGSLALGTLVTAEAGRLSPVVSHFSRAYPEVRLSLTTGASRSLAVDVVESRLDGSFIAGPFGHPELRGETVFREELVLVTSRTIGPLKRLSSMQDVKTIVFRVGCLYHQRLEELLAEIGIPVTATLQFGSLEAIIACRGRSAAGHHCHP